MNAEVRQFHTAIISSEIDDVELFNGFLKFYVSKNYTLKDLQDTLIIVYKFDYFNTIQVIFRILELLYI